MIKGILFDKDGTLLEFEQTWHAIMSEYFEALKTACRLDDLQIARIKRMSGFQADGFAKESLIQYLTMNDLFKRWQVLLDLEETFLYEARKTYDQVLEMTQVEMLVLPRVRETLDYLKKKGYIMGIVTADQKQSTLYGLKKTGLLSYFSYFGWDDSRTQGKPNPYMAESFCQKNGLKPHEVVMVGDSLTDYEFALNANLHFAAINNDYGYFSQLEIKESYPILNRMDELLTYYQL